MVSTMMTATGVMKFNDDVNQGVRRLVSLGISHKEVQKVVLESLRQAEIIINMINTVGGIEPPIDIDPFEDEEL